MEKTFVCITTSLIRGISDHIAMIRYDKDQAFEDAADHGCDRIESFDQHGDHMHVYNYRHDTFIQEVSKHD